MSTSQNEISAEFEEETPVTSTEDSDPSSESSTSGSSNSSSSSTETSTGNDQEESKSEESVEKIEEKSEKIEEIGEKSAKKGGFTKDGEIDFKPRKVGVYLLFFSPQKSYCCLIYYCGRKRKDNGGRKFSHFRSFRNLSFLQQKEPFLY